MTDAGEELVAVPRSLLGAACAAIRGRRGAPNTLSQLNRYAVHGPALAKPASSPAGVDAREALPDDIRAAGWTVAVHNDYRLNGEPHTFWLFTKGGQAIKGEGRSDAEALNAVRAALSASTSAAEPVAFMAYDQMRAITQRELDTIPEANGRRSNCKALYPTALYATPPAPAVVDGQRVKEVRRVRHKKRGTTYRVLHGAVMQSTHWHDTRFKVPADGRAVVVYQSEDDGSVWARPATEFEDGRFEDLRACLATDKEGE